MSDNVTNFPISEEKKYEELLESTKDVYVEDDDSPIPTREYTKEERTGYSEEVEVGIKVESGERIILPPSEDDAEEEFISAELSDFLTSDIGTIELDDDTIAKAAEEMNIDAIEMTEFINLVKEYKACDGKIPNLYNRLPKTFKQEIEATILKNGASVAPADLKHARSGFAKSLLDSFIQDTELNQISIDFDKQMASIVKEYSKEMADYYSSSMEEKIEAMNKAAEELLETDREKSDMLYGIATAMRESYELESFKEEIKRVKIKKFDIEKPNRIFDTITFKYKDSKFSISDPSQMSLVFAKHLDCTPLEGLKLTLAFCKVCRNYSVSNLAQHTFMYYFITNVLSLNITAPDREYDEFTQNFIDRLKECLANLKD